MPLIGFGGGITQRNLRSNVRLPSHESGEADDELHKLVDGDGLRDSDKQQDSLRDADRGSYQPEKNRTADERTPHQDAQHGTDVRGQSSMVQRDNDTPEGLRRERKGPLDKSLGRSEEATQGPGTGGLERRSS